MSLAHPHRYQAFTNSPRQVVQVVVKVGEPPVPLLCHVVRVQLRHIARLVPHPPAAAAAGCR